MAGTGHGTPKADFGLPGAVPTDPLDFEPAVGIPWQSGLDPLTGLADRRWFLRAVAVSDGSVSGAANDVGIIAVRINGLRSLLVSHGRVAADGVLLLAAEVLHGWSRGDDLAARLGVDSFGVLAHTDAAGLAATAARLRRKLAGAGVSATVGSAMRAAQGGASQALRTANRDLGKSNGTDAPIEAAASRAIRGAERRDCGPGDPGPGDRHLDAVASLRGRSGTTRARLPSPRDGPPGHLDGATARGGRIGRSAE